MASIFLSFKVVTSKEATFFQRSITICGLVYRSQYSDSLWAGQSADQILVGARCSAPIQTGPGANPASDTMGTGSFPGV
jgi:hypothetical protein